MIVALTLGFLVAVFAVLALLLSKLGGKQEIRVVTPDLLDEFTLDQYRPMMRLLSVEDFRYLRSQPGFRPWMEARVRRQRIHLFRAYLAALQTDFGKLCGALAVVMVRSQCDRKDLASALLNSRIQFACGVFKLRLQLVLFRFGLSDVDVKAVLGTFQAVRADLGVLTPCQAGAAA